jgi:hypothetical protein
MVRNGFYGSPPLSQFNGLHTFITYLNSSSITFSKSGAHPSGRQSYSLPTFFYETVYTTWV